MTWCVDLQVWSRQISKGVNHFVNNRRGARWPREYSPTRARGWSFFWTPSQLYPPQTRISRGLVPDLARNISRYDIHWEAEILRLPQIRVSPIAVSLQQRFTWDAENTKGILPLGCVMLKPGLGAPRVIVHHQANFEYVDLYEASSLGVQAEKPWQWIPTPVSWTPANCPWAP